jgi:hypothetical protein
MFEQNLTQLTPKSEVKKYKVYREITEKNDDIF